MPKTGKENNILGEYRELCLRSAVVWVPSKVNPTMRIGAQGLSRGGEPSKDCGVGK